MPKQATKDGETGGRKLTLPEWLRADIQTRHDWLMERRILDSTSSRVLQYAMAFKQAGASISDEAMLAAYESEKLPSEEGA